MTTDRPRIIVLEGPHGSGKSTLARALAEALGAWHHVHHATPGASPWEAACRYAAQRAEALRRATAAGATLIVSDRWALSTGVLAAVLDDEALRLLRQAERAQYRDPLLTLVCDAPESVCRARVEARGETWGARESAEHREIGRLARIRATDNVVAGSWCLIDTTRDRDVVLAEALGIVRGVL